MLEDLTQEDRLSTDILNWQEVRIPYKAGNERVGGLLVYSIWSVELLTR